MVVTAAGRRKLENALPAWREAQRRAEERLSGGGFGSLRRLGDALLAESGVVIDPPV